MNTIATSLFLSGFQRTAGGYVRPGARPSQNSSAAPSPRPEGPRGGRSRLYMLACELRDHGVNLDRGGAGCGGYVLPTIQGTRIAVAIEAEASTFGAARASAWEAEGWQVVRLPLAAVDNAARRTLAAVRIASMVRAARAEAAPSIFRDMARACPVDLNGSTVVRIVGAAERKLYA